jgi:Asp/Glu/hydantoin racemase
MNLLLINPNISTSVTALIEAEARRAALESTRFNVQTAPAGVAYIETPAESVIAAYETFRILADHHGQYDGAIVAAFGDPGVSQAKELLDVPVIGLTEAALANAFLLGGRFAIVGISERIGRWYEETVAHLGMGARFIGYHGLGEAFRDVGTVGRDARDILLDMCRRCAAAGADSIILGGAPLAGLARDIADQVPVPLVDGVGSAVRMAESMVRAGYPPRRSGALAVPPEKPYRNLPPGLSALIGRRTE